MQQTCRRQCNIYCITVTDP